MSNLRYKSCFKYICQNQDLQIQCFIVYKAPDVQSTNVKNESSVTDICRFFAIYVIVFCETSCNPGALNDTLHIPLYVAVAVMDDNFFFQFFLNFFRINFPPKIWLPCHLR